MSYALYDKDKEVSIKAVISNPNIDLSFYRDENIYDIKKYKEFYILKIKPRFPAQLAESAFYFILFLFSSIFYKKIKRFDGLNFALYLSLIFIFRFLIEFLKENQVDSENEYILNFGQLLSVPIILFCILIIFFRKKTWK